MKQNGFTLIELLVVIAILAILSTAAATSYLGIQSKAKDSKRKSDVESISKAYEVKFNGTYSQLAGTDFSPPVIPQDPYGGDYYNVLALDGSGYKVCAVLENNPSTYCKNNSGDCYCKISNQSTIKNPANISGPGSQIGY